MPVHADIPPLDVRWLNDPDPNMPLGLLGVGEVGITGAAAAVANSIHHATGRRVRDLSITVSLADIAAEVGMHKSALLRYFTTRDEIYLHLAARDWQDWAEAIARALADAPTGSTGDVAGAFTRTLADRPLLCDLLAHVPLNLERNVPIESARVYKLAVLSAADRILTHVHRALPDLADADLWDLIAGVTSVAAGLHQVVHPPPTLAALAPRWPMPGKHGIPFVSYMKPGCAVQADSVHNSSGACNGFITLSSQVS